MLSKKQQGNRTRHFKVSWYRSYNWLHYCTSRHKVFCFFCRKACKLKLISCNKRRQDAFVSLGFNNLIEKFKEHEKSQMHVESYFKLNALSRPSVATQLSAQILKQQFFHRKMLLKVLSTLRYLVRQGLAIRGHHHDDGNLIQLLNCRSEDITSLRSWMLDRKYLSHDIINEQIAMMAQWVLNTLITDIKNGDSGIEQFVVCLRWVGKDYLVNEDLISLVDVEQTDSATLTDKLKLLLSTNGFYLRNCRGQAYDGAANMSGCINGVAMRILNEQPKAHYMHCAAHSLNLCLQDCSTQCKSVRDASSMTTEISTIIRSSPKRLAQFRHLQEELSPGVPGLKPLCPTRWTVRTESLHAVIKNYPIIMKELDVINEEAKGESSRKSLGVVALMEKFSTYFGLKMSLMVFSAMEQLSRTLEYRDINAQEVLSSVKMANNFLERQRSDSAFNLFYEAVVREAESITNEPTLPRQRQIPHRINDGCCNYQFSSPKDYFRQQYFETLDLLRSEIMWRFNQPTFDIMSEMENMLVHSCNQIDENKDYKNFDEMYKDDIDINKLKIQLSLLPDVLKTSNEEHKIGIKKVTKVKTICEMFNVCKFPKTMLSEVDKVLRLYLTLPLTSPSAERCFSGLRRLKSYFRSTMTQKRLNQLMLLYAHNDRVDELHLPDIAKEFIQKNPRRTSYFGTFS